MGSFDPDFPLTGALTAATLDDLASGAEVEFDTVTGSWVTAPDFKDIFSSPVVALEDIALRPLSLSSTLLTDRFRSLQGRVPSASAHARV